MKIVCGSCQAKYSIADEKVAGKVFKIRCKRCSEVIVVRGDQDEAQDGGGDEASVDAIWHVVVNGEQAGPYTPAQLSQMLSGGQIDWEAYVWCEGFENWLPMRDVPDLVALLTGGHAEEREEARHVAVAAAPAMLAAQPSMGADPFADEAPAAMFAQPVAQPVAAVAGGGARRNLFGDVSSSRYETGPKVVASAPGPRVSAEQAMTGARNENSVLFSLKNLQALATGTSTPAAAPSGASFRPGHAAGEGSGLIDIRALASATGVADHGRAETEKDALLSLGSAQAGAFGALGSPMLAPAKAEDEGGKKGLVFAILGGFALLSVAAIAIAVIMKPQSQSNPGVVAPVPPPMVGAAVPGAVPGASPTAAAPTQPNIPPEAPSEGERHTQENANSNNPSNANNADSHHHGGSKRPGGTDKPTSEPVKPPVAAAPVETAKPTPAKPPRGNSIEALLDDAIGNQGKSAAKHESAPAAASNMPEKPSRDDVMNAMNGVKDAVKACGKGQTGVAFADVTVSGKTGRISNVEVTGMTGEVGSCIARSVRKAVFPKFKAENMQVKFPFRL